MSNNSSATIFDLSRNQLQQQLVTNILWVTWSVLGLVSGSLQICTTIVWKPLRKIDHALLLAITIGDVSKCLGFGTNMVRRLYNTFSNASDVRTQRNCMAWIVNQSIPADVVEFLILSVSLDRLLGLIAPVWYKTQKRSLKIFLMGFSVCAGITVGGAVFAGSSDNLISTCGLGPSPVENYRLFNTWFLIGMLLVVLAINIVTCFTFIYRWWMAKRAKQDMKVFKKNIQLQALKTLLALMTVYLISSFMSSFWVSIGNFIGWDDATRSRYPLGSWFTLIRGALDFPIYLIMIKEYRKGLVFIWSKFRYSTGNTSAVVPMSSSGNAPRLDSVAHASRNNRGTGTHF